MHEPYVLWEQYEPPFLWDGLVGHGGLLHHVDGFDDAGGRHGDDDDVLDVVLLLV